MTSVIFFNKVLVDAEFADPKKPAQTLSRYAEAGVFSETVQVYFLEFNVVFGKQTVQSNLVHSSAYQFLRPVGESSACFRNHWCRLAPSYGDLIGLAFSAHFLYMELSFTGYRRMHFM